ncbi:MAG: cobalt ECF transporter T component CbiQ [Candidatus Brocadia sp.]|nr:cobalt ECF transporter T component CbiQ [Candidatus Brocadia sp.]
MDFFRHTFSDVYARQNNWLTRVDVRVKLFYVVSLLAINLWAKNIFIPSLFVSASFILLLSVKVPLNAILRCMFLPVLFAILILVVKCLHEGEKVWLSFSILGYKVILKEEGLHSGLHVCGKVLGGISIVIIFSFTTSISRLCAGLKWFRVPNTVVELMAFMYRYIFLLLDEVSAMWTAQRSRLGHASWKRTIKSFGTLGGLLIIRAFERAERTYEAMYVRGYEGGGILTINLSPWSRKESVLAAGIVLMLPLLVYTGNMRIW